LSVDNYPENRGEHFDARKINFPLRQMGAGDEIGLFSPDPTRRKSARKYFRIARSGGQLRASYFRSWVGSPIKWRGTSRRPIPDNWHSIEQRSSPFHLAGNRNAAHPGDATLRFSTLCDVAAMIETMPLERAEEAYAKMMSGKARFRMVLTMT
jgi:hypothetical protein